MIDAFLQGIVAFLSSYKYLFLLVAALLEGRVLGVLAGFLISTKELAFWPTYLILVFGNLVPDALYYFLGKFGSNLKFVKRYSQKIQTLEKFWHKYSGKMIIFGKITMVFIVPILILSGLVKYPLKKVLKYSVITDLIFILGLLGIGYFFGNIFEDNSKYFFFIMATLVLVSLFVFFVLKYFNRKRGEKIKLSKDKE